MSGAYGPATGAKSGEYVPDEGTWGGDGNIFIEYRACHDPLRHRIGCRIRMKFGQARDFS